jgi:pyruvate dehydrogenase E2 component (dihydrolipoamide acetyltransferase)
VRGFRAVIAQRMAASHEQTAPVTLAAEADATALVGLRRQLQQDGVTVSYTDLFIQVLARALRDHPRLNATLDGDAIKVWSNVHVGIAVDTERGLLVPVLRNVEQKGLQQIAQETASLITRAQSGQCTPDEMQGGRFTLTNLGMFGVDMFTPIINLPQCAILGIGRIKTQPVMVGNAVVGREMVWLSLTFDHRLVDGAPAARFLQRVVQMIEHPHLLLT